MIYEIVESTYALLLPVRDREVISDRSVGNGKRGCDIIGLVTALWAHGVWREMQCNGPLLGPLMDIQYNFNF